MNIIFLDVDGVLNSTNNLIKVYQKTRKTYSGYNYPFDELCLENLYELVTKTQSKLVITSTWRKDEEGKIKLLEILSHYQLEDMVIGYTPVLNSTRGAEIKAFLQELDGHHNFIILDDDSDMENLAQYLVKTKMQTGLTKENVSLGIKKLTI